MLKEIEAALSELFDVKILKERRPDLSAQYRMVPLRHTDYILYLDKSLDYKTVFKLKSRLELLLARFEQLETIAAEHALLNVELKEMGQAARAGFDLEAGLEQEFEFVRDFKAEYALLQEGRVAANSGLDAFTLKTARQRLANTGDFELLIKQGELVGYRTELFSLVVLSAQPLGEALKDALQAKLWWLTRAHRQATSELEVIFNAFPDIYFRLDADGVILDYKAHPTIPLPPDILGKPIRAAIPDQEAGDRFVRAIQQVRQTKSLVSFEYPLAIQGRRYFYGARLAPLQKTQIVVIIRDVTKRKQAEEVLEEQQTFLRQVLDINPNFVFVRDRQGRFVLANQAIANAYGVSVEDIIGKTDADFDSNSEKVERIWREDRQVIDSGQEMFVPESRITDAEGNIHWMQTIKRPLVDEDGVVRRVLGVSADVTKRKKAEEALRQSEERFRLLFEAAPDGITLLDDRGFIVDCNPAALRLYDRPAKEVIGQHITGFIAPPFKQVFKEVAPQLRQLNLQERELQVIKANGNVVDIWRKGSPVADSEGNLNSILVYDRDITALKQAEAELRKLYRAVEQSASTIVITDLNGTIEFVNPAFSRITGYSAQEAIGQNPRILKSDQHPPEFYQEMWATLSKGDVWQGELVNKKKNGELYWEAATISPVKDGAGKTTHYLAIKEDVTERRQAEEALRRADSIIRTSPAVAFMWRNDEGWPVEFISDNVIELFGYTAEEFISAKVAYSDVVHPDDLERVVEEVSRHSREKARQSFVHEPYRILSKDGQIKWVDDRTHIRRDEKGQITHYQGLVLDITARKKAEEALRQSEERFRLLFEAAPDGVTVLDDKGFIVDCNPAALRLYDRPVKDVIGRHITEFVALSFKQVFKDVVSQLRQLKPQELEIQVIKANGNVVDVWRKGMPKTDPEGNFNGILIYDRDITALKRAETEASLLLALTKGISEAPDFSTALNIALRLVSEHTNWIFGEAWIPSFDGTVLENSRASYYRDEKDERLREFDRTSQPFTFLPGVGLPGRVWVSGQTEWHQNITNLSEKMYHRVKYAAEIGLKATLGVPIVADGQALAVLVFYMAEPRPEDRRLVELVSAVATQLGTVLHNKQAEEEIRKLSRAVEQSASTIVITNLNGTIEFVNPAFSQITGYSAQEAIGQNPRILKSGQHPPKFYQKMWATLSKGDVWQGELVNKKKNGELYWEAATISPVKDEVGKTTHYLAIKEDVTERKQMEEELRIKRRQAETLRAATQALSSTLDLPRVFELILSELQKVVPYDSVSVQQLKGDRLEIIGCRGFPNPEEIMGISFNLTGDDNPNRQVIETQAPRIIHNPASDYPEFETGRHAPANIASWLGVPLLFGDKPIGMIAVDKQESDFYNREHARLAMSFAAQAAVAIENARLFDEARQAIVAALEVSRLKSHILATVNHDLRTPLGPSWAILNSSRLVCTAPFLTGNKRLRPRLWTVLIT